MTSMLMAVDRPRVCRRITREVCAAAETCRATDPTLDLDVACEHRGLPAELLRRRVDVLLVDGHAGQGGLSLAALARAHTGAVSAPVVITGWCWAAGGDYRAVLAQCLAVPQVVQIGSADHTQYEDAQIVYPPVIAAITRHGTAASRLLPVLEPLLARLPTRHPWTASVLTAAQPEQRS